MAGDIPLHNWDEQSKKRKKEKEKNMLKQLSDRQPGLSDWIVMPYS